jgi:capsular polysaccharide transport system permease protein
VRKARSFPTLRTLSALILREMVTSYGRSPGGYLWAILEPAAGTALMTLIFSLGFRSPPLGSNFPIFYATGIVPFFMYNDLSNKVATAIQYSKALLVYPSVTFVDAILARFILNAITQILVGYIILSFIIIVLDAPTSMDFDRVVLGFAMAMTLGLGIGTLNCFLFSMMPLWQRAWSILTRPLFIVSGIFFIYDNIPDPYQGWLWYNPLVHVVGIVRSGFYARYDATYASPAYVFGIAAVALVAGLLFLRRYHRDILYN